MKYGGSRSGRGWWVWMVELIKGGSSGSSESSESASAYATNKSFIII